MMQLRFPTHRAAPIALLLGLGAVPVLALSGPLQLPVGYYDLLAVEEGYVSELSQDLLNRVGLSEGKDRGAVLFTHHQIGKLLATEAQRKCLEPAGSPVSKVEGGWNAPIRPFVDANRKIVHIVPDPFGLLVAGYHNHRGSSSEGWLHSTEHAQENIWPHLRDISTGVFHQEDIEFLDELVQSNVSYHEFLGRAPPIMGMLAEMSLALSGGLERIRCVSKLCQTIDGCLEVCLEHSVAESPDFNSTWASIGRFLNFDMSSKIKNGTTVQDCLSTINMESLLGSAKGKEATDTNLDKEFIVAMEGAARTLDQKVFNGELARRAASYGCVSAPRPAPVPQTRRDAIKSFKLEGH